MITAISSSVAYFKTEDALGVATRRKIEAEQATTRERKAKQQIVQSRSELQTSRDKIERLLVETDAPFLAPPPHRGKRNEPAFVVEVARAVARLRGETVEDVGRAALENYSRAFKLPQV